MRLSPLDDYLNRRSLVPEAYGKSVPVGVFASLYRRLECAAVLAHHEGCVNACYWDESGRLLASGSDDTQLVVWRYPEAKLMVAKPSGHTANIFCTKFLPDNTSAEAARTIVTASGDSEIRVFKLKKEELELERIFGCHQNRAKKVDAVIQEPQVFLSAGEDGTVRFFDLRQPHACAADTGCRNAIVSCNLVSFYSVSTSPIQPQYFATAGSEAAVRIYDRRRLSDNASRTFDEPAFAWLPADTTSEMVTSARFSNYAMDVVASYNQDNIYITNIFDSSVSRRLQPASKSGAAYVQAVEAKLLEAYSSKRKSAYDRLLQSHRKYQFVKPWDHIYAYEHFNRALLLVASNGNAENLTSASTSFKLACTLVPNDERLLFAWLLSLSLIRNEPIRGSREIFALGTPSFLEKHEEEFQRLRRMFENNQLDRTLLLRMLSHLEPVNILATPEWHQIAKQNQVFHGYRQELSGHINVQTVKDVNFLGPRSEFVVSGSDTGHFFIWDRRDSTIIFVGESDGSVVNCIEPNPVYPAIAVGGIDNDIKIWEPIHSKLPSSSELKWRSVPKNEWEPLVRAARISSSEQLYA